MSTVAVLGAGPIGAAVAQRLAARARVREVRFIDANVSVASGKALDIMQAGPVEHYDTRVTAMGDVLAATGANVIVVADEVDGGEWEGDRGLTMMRQLARAGTTAAIVFAGPKQIWLMETCARELKMRADKLVGTAPAAAAGAVRALAGLELGLSTVDVTVVGRPPSFTIAWSTATADGVLISERVPAHRLLAISDSLKRLWPPGPYAIGAATAPIAEALIDGRRRRHAALAILDGEFGARGVAAMLPLELGDGRILARVRPSLSASEGTGVFSTVSG